MTAGRNGTAPTTPLSLGGSTASARGWRNFRKYAESAYLIISEVYEEEDEDYRLHPAEHGYHGWMKVLHSLALEFPTPLLRCTFRRWGPEEEWIRLGGILQALHAPEDSLYLPPLDHTCLVHSVFASSMAAIDIILDDTKAFLVGEPFGFPLNLPWSSLGVDQANVGEPRPDSEKDHVTKQGDRVARQDVPVAEASHEVAHQEEGIKPPATEQSDDDFHQEEGIKPPVLAYGTDGYRWKFEFDKGDGNVEFKRPKYSVVFCVYEKLLANPNVLFKAKDLVVSSARGKKRRRSNRDDDYEERQEMRRQGLRVGVRDNFGEEPLADDDFVNLQYAELRQVVKETHSPDVDKDRLPFLIDRRNQLEVFLRSVLDDDGNIRTVRSSVGVLSNTVGVQEHRARQYFRTHMPKFAEYLEKTTTRENGTWIFEPHRWHVAPPLSAAPLSPSDS